MASVWSRRREMRSFVIVAAAFCLNAFTLGPMKSYGPFFISFENNLNATAGQASLAPSLMFGANFLGGPFASFFVNRFGYRATTLLGASLASLGSIACSFSQTMVTVQLCSASVGFGCCLANMPSLAIIGNRFKEKRSFANNIMTMGSALISIPLPILVQLWIDKYSWRGAVLLLGGFFLNGLPSGLLLTTESGQCYTKRNKSLIDFGLLRSIPFCAYVMACGCNMGAMLCVNIYMVRFAQSRGVNDYLAALLPSIMSIVDLVLRPISGYVTSLSHIGPIRIERIHIFSATLLIHSFVMAAFTFCWSVEAFIATAVIYAVIAGCRGALSLTITADLFGGDKLVSALGWRYLVMGVFSMTVPPLMGKIVDSVGSYAIPFYAGAALGITAVGLVLVVLATISKNPSQDEEYDDKYVPTPTTINKRT